MEEWEWLNFISIIISKRKKMSKKKLDLFNLFYSFGAVIILIGVIAKFLEWAYEDELLISGLCTEALVFILSSIQYKKVMAQYKWERVFPELLDASEENSGGVAGLHERIEGFSTDYLAKLETHVNSLEEFQETFSNTTIEFQASIQSAIDAISDLSQNFSAMSEKSADASIALGNMRSLNDKTAKFDSNLENLNKSSVSSADQLEGLKQQIQMLNISLQQFNTVSSGILNQFKQIGK
jgi:gliding motility-associated protein GldL